jgi:hypothetical protein
MDQWAELRQVGGTLFPADPVFPAPSVSHSYGYGLLDAGAMVALAQNWTTVAPQRKCIIDLLTEPK